MAITTLKITDFRNLAAVELNPCSYGLNVICGNNGSGKTSLLEAIYYLGLGRSFRSSSSGRLIRHSANKFALFAQLLTENQHSIPVGIERDTVGSMRLRLAEKDAPSITELAYFLPIRIINSQSHQLFESGPVFRRKYLDWGLFYQFANFLPCWRNFERILKQRNAALRDKRPKKELMVWTEELVCHGLELDALRRSYIEALTPLVKTIAQDLLPVSQLKIHYQPGWNQTKEYAEVLASHLQEEYQLGYTLFGPHRADIDITINSISVKHFLSRGQQKLLICAMILAQGMLFATHANKGLIYLVDDLPSELDLQNRQKLILLLAKQFAQVFITAIDSEMVCDFISDQPEIPMKVFHVKQGSIIV